MVLEPYDFLGGRTSLLGTRVCLLPNLLVHAVDVLDLEVTPFPKAVILVNTVGCHALGDERLHIDAFREDWLPPVGGSVSITAANHIVVISGGEGLEHSRVIGFHGQHPDDGIEIAGPTSDCFPALGHPQLTGVVLISLRVVANWRDNRTMF